MKKWKMIDCKKYVGKFFERDTGSHDYCVCEITGFNEKYFLVTEYYLTLGFSTKEINQKKIKEFVTAKNFREITKEQFNIVKKLCIEPFVTIWDENDVPYYCRELKEEYTK